MTNQPESGRVPSPSNKKAKQSIACPKCLTSHENDPRAYYVIKHSLTAAIDTVSDDTGSIVGYNQRDMSEYILIRCKSCGCQFEHTEQSKGAS